MGRGQRHSKNAGIMGSEALTYHEKKALGFGTVKERIGKVSQQRRITSAAPYTAALAAAGALAAAAAGASNGRGLGHCAALPVFAVQLLWSHEHDSLQIGPSHVWSTC
jgi:hypothetical protein